MSKIERLTMTCQAAPSQWEGIMDDGRHVYIRYRWGTLSWGFGKTREEAIRDGSHSKDLGDGYDGEMETPVMLRHTGLELNWKVEDEL